MVAGTSKSSQDLKSRLFAAADKLCSNMGAAVYKHVVFGLIFLKYVSDSFELMHQKVSATEHSDPEDPDEYRAENVFWVPKEPRWQHLRDNARQPIIGHLIDEAMQAGYTCR